MAHSNERTPAPAGVSAGPQSGAEGTGGEPRSNGLRAQAHERSTPDQGADAGNHLAEHASDKDQPGYRARPAGQSGLAERPGRPSPLREPQGDGNYIATDRGDEPLRDG
jgi:hypothetical protein